MKVISRKDALISGEKWYFTGKPCKHGHISKRLVSSESCYQCDMQRTGKWKAENKSKVLEYAKSYYKANRALLRQKNLEWYKANAENAKSYARLYSKLNRSVVQSWCHIRRSKKKAAIPAWFGELDAFVWAEAIDLAKRRFKQTGLKWHADHMVPLACKTASGLHTWSNCQVIPASINVKKKNKLYLHESMQWLNVLTTAP